MVSFNGVHSDYAIAIFMFLLNLEMYNSLLSIDDTD